MCLVLFAGRPAFFCCAAKYGCILCLICCAEALPTPMTRGSMGADNRIVLYDTFTFHGALLGAVEGCKEL